MKSAAAFSSPASRPATAADYGCARSHRRNLGRLRPPVAPLGNRCLGTHTFLNGLWLVFFPLVAMVLAMLALSVLYWVARPKEESLGRVLPGAMLATLLLVAGERHFRFFMFAGCLTAWCMEALPP